MAKKNEDVTIKVKVKSKVQADQPTDNSSVLFLNSKGAFTFVPETMGKKLEASHKGFILTKDHDRYMEGYKIALGVSDNVSTKKFVQKAGTVYAIEETGRIDLDSLIRKEEEAAKAAKADGKK